MRLLLSIEKAENPIEIVLHVYKLKEGWDVNNLFTIIPLNAAKSDILAMQTIGRGLRLPFGFITGDEDIIRWTSSPMSTTVSWWMRSRTVIFSATGIWTEQVSSRPILWT